MPVDEDYSWAFVLRPRYTDDRTDAEERARARRADPERWKVRKFALSEEPDIDPDDPRSSSECVAEVWPLTLRMWAISGRPIPDYSRSETPGVVIRGKRQP